MQQSVDAAALGDPLVTEVVPGRGDVLEVGVVVDDGRLIGHGIRGDDRVECSNGSEESTVEQRALDLRIAQGEWRAMSRPSAERTAG